MPTDILCRFDARDQQAVVFLRDSINGDKIQVWNGKGNPQWMPLDYYKMTNPLSAADEKVLMERYKQATGKQDQVIRITHRLPRNSRPLPNMLTDNSSQIKDINPPPAAKTPTASKPASGAKPIEAQTVPSGPTGDLPKAGETPAALPATQPTVPGESPSASLFRRIQELQARMSELVTRIATMNAEVRNATTDYETAKQACAELTKEFEAAIEVEAAEEMRKRREMLAAVTSAVATIPDPLAQAAQTLHDTATAQPSQQPTQTPPADSKQAGNANSKPRGQGGKFASKSTKK